MDYIEAFTKAAKEFGVFFALFTVLFGWVLWTNNKRETRYLTVIQTLSEDVKERLTKIETKLEK